MENGGTVGSTVLSGTTGIHLTPGFSSVANGYRLTFQSDGNLVIVKRDGGLISETSTNQSDNNRATRAEFGPAGTLILFNRENVPVWKLLPKEVTNGTNGAKMTILENGHLQILNKDNKQLWVGNLSDITGMY
jgi:hypothetical protein